MKLRTKLLALVLAFAMIFSLAACGKGDDNGLVPAADPYTSFKSTADVTSDSLYVKKVDGLADDFIMGMDASAVLSLEASGVKYYGFDGTEQDVFKVLADNGINTIRVRVWNDPFDKNGHGYGGGNCNIDTAVEIGKRATKYGMNLLVNFHYSDFWADPSKQMVPKAWKKLSIDEKAEELYNYTKTSLNKLNEAGVRISMVQVGNETNGKFCGETNWGNMSKLFNAGSKAVRELCPKAKVALHFANPEATNRYDDYATRLKNNKVDYDVLCSSYYPYWHGTFDNLKVVLNGIHEKFGKETMIVETSYAFTGEDTDFYPNTISAGESNKPQPFTVQGQSNQIRNTIETAAQIDSCLGVCYWEGTWITAGGASYEENQVKWEQFGSGWAASYAAGYDPNDAGKYYGGCSVDNQAFFDATGHPLESLKVWSLVKRGNTVEIKADALEDAEIFVDLNSKTIDMPETVNAVMNDASRNAVAVTWDIDDDKIAEMLAGGPKNYEIAGTASGMSCTCVVHMIEFNYLTNYSFEDDDVKNGEDKSHVQPIGWTATQLGTSAMYVENKQGDSLTGNNHYHFYNASADGVEFTLEQTVTDLPAGKYKFGISVMGDAKACGEYEIYCYVKINGTEFDRKTMNVTEWGKSNWDTQTITGFTVAAGDEVVVGIYVKAPGAGAWGKIDDGMLNSMAE